MELIDMQEFMDWLEARSLVPSGQVRFYVMWVERFLRSTSASLNVSDKDRLMHFEDFLARDPHCAEWQRDQASRAVKLYLEGFCKEHGEMGDGSQDVTDDRGEVAGDRDWPDGFREGFERVKELIRLRPICLRTAHISFESRSCLDMHDFQQRRFMRTL